MKDQIAEHRLHIFDLDDTLINSRSAYRTAHEKALLDLFPDVTEEEHRINVELIHWLCRSFGSGLPEKFYGAFLRCTDLNVLQPDKVLAQMLVVYRDWYAKLLKPLDGVTDYLDQLISNGKRVALVSNGSPTSQEKKLTYTKLLDYFPKSVRYISGNFPSEEKKPSPYMIELCCQQQNISAVEAVYYGNETSDVVAANLAGVTSVIFNSNGSNDQNGPVMAEADWLLSSWVDMIG